MPVRQAKQPSGIGSLESILCLLKSLKIWALASANAILISAIVAEQLVFIYKKIPKIDRTFLPMRGSKICERKKYLSNVTMLELKTIKVSP